MNPEVKIVVDSAADLSAEEAAQSGVQVVPLSIRFGDAEFIDGVDLSREEFWDRMANDTEFPSTAAPSPGAFEEAFRNAATEGYKSVVCLTISAKISATHQIARSAADAVRDVIDVHVVDTEACAIAETTLFRTAVEMAAGGAPGGEIVAAIESMRKRVHLFAALDTLENLKKGGRIGAAGAFFGSLLSVKPIVGLVDGEVKAVARTRTRTKALDHLAELVLRNETIDNLIVGHSYAPDLEAFLERIESVIDRNKLTVSIIGSVVGTHTGPRLIAVSFTTPA